MAYTAAQWARIQASLPPEDRVSYADYLASLPDAAAAPTPLAPATPAPVVTPTPVVVTPAPAPAPVFVPGRVANPTPTVGLAPEDVVTTPSVPPVSTPALVVPPEPVQGPAVTQPPSQVQGPVVPGQVLEPAVPGVTPGVAGPAIPQNVTNTQDLPPQTGGTTTSPLLSSTGVPLGQASLDYIAQVTSTTEGNAVYLANIAAGMGPVQAAKDAEKTLIDAANPAFNDVTNNARSKVTVSLGKLVDTNFSQFIDAVGKVEAIATGGGGAGGTGGAAGGLTTDAVQKMLNDALAAQQAKFDASMKALLDQQQQMQQQQVESQRRSAYDVMRERFASYGLTGLADELTAILKGEGVTRGGQRITDIPTTSAGFYLALTETKAYYDRFGIVNEQRIKEGYTALDEKTILGLEDQYQEVMKAYNAPPGFYDNPEDFRTFLRLNKSKAEVADTMQAYADFVKSTDPTVRQQLKDYYGIDDASLTAYFADPVKGQTILDNIASKNLNTAAALSQGLSAQLAQLASGFGAAGMTYGQQKQKYGAAAQEIQFGQKASAIYGIDYTPEMAVAAEFAGDQAALASQRRAKRREIAEFQGQTGAGAISLGRGTAGLI